jgi:hypothetical protein
VKGKDFIEQVRRSISAAGSPPATDRAVAKHLGISVAGLANWKAREGVTTRQIAGLLSSVANASRQRTQAEAIRPIVEFFQIRPVSVGDGDQYRIFGTGTKADPHPYLAGLKAELEKHRGVYLFYDSRGRALYAGKTRAQFLWQEMNLAYNRDRDLQNILRVQHPERRQDFRTSDEMRRQIRKVNVRLHELAEYVSAYQVADEMIGDIESLLIRAFPNDLLNKKIENFTWS